MSLSLFLLCFHSYFHSHSLFLTLSLSLSFSLSLSRSFSRSVQEKIVLEENTHTQECRRTNEKWEGIDPSVNTIGEDRISSVRLTYWPHCVGEMCGPPNETILSTVWSFCGHLEAKRTEQSCPSLTEMDGSLGPQALRTSDNHTRHTQTLSHIVEDNQVLCCVV